MKIEDLTKYEYARIMGARALQLFLGAPPMIDATKYQKSFLEVAQQEFEKNLIPLVVQKN